MTNFSDEFVLRPSEHSRLRRLANRHGYALHKSRRRSGTIDNVGGYMLVDADTNIVVSGSRFDMTGKDVADWIAPAR